MASTGTAPARIAKDPAEPAAKPPAMESVQAGANWFFWISGLAVLDAVVRIFGGKIHVVIGLGTTAVVDALAKQASPNIVLGVIVSSWTVALFCMFGGF